MKNYHITVGTSEDLDRLVDRVRRKETVVWPIPKKATVGDVVLFLIPAFVGDVVASGVVQNLPSPSERWPSKYEATVADVRLRNDPIPIDLLQLRLPDWKYLGYARTYTTVPSEFVEALRDLLDTERRLDVEIGTSPDELDFVDVLVEGAVLEVCVNEYERNPKARARCIEHYGSVCCICECDLGKAYGAAAEGLIHVHHLRPFSEIGEEYEVDPIRDLRPVCPNCHAVIHRRTPPYSVEEVKAFLGSLEE